MLLDAEQYCVSIKNLNKNNVYNNYYIKVYEKRFGGKFNLSVHLEILLKSTGVLINSPKYTEHMRVKKKFDENNFCI